MKSHTWEEAAFTLNNGGLAIIPTDTIYGLIAKATDKEAVTRLDQAKKRPQNKPYIILIGDIADLSQLGIVPTSRQKDILDQTWPGPWSFIFDNSQYRNAPVWLFREGLSPPVRLPGHQELQKMLKTTGPICAPSANPTNQNPAGTLEEARGYFGPQVAAYVRAVKEPLTGNPSTVAKLDSNGRILILRQGAGVWQKSLSSQNKEV